MKAVPGNPSTSSYNPTQDDMEARTTIIFGTFGTLMAAVGIILAGVTLRFMYQSHLAKSDNGSRVVIEDGLELQVTGSRIAPQETSAIQEA